MSLVPYVARPRHPAKLSRALPWRLIFQPWVQDVKIRLKGISEAASSKTLEALAQVIRALAPEVSGVSFHDFAADTLWLSEDFLLPEDHQLVEDSLSSDSAAISMFPMRRARTATIPSPSRCAIAKAGDQRRGASEHRCPIMDPRTDGIAGAEARAGVRVPVGGIRTAQGFPLAASARTARSGAQIENALHAERFEFFLQPICSLHDNVGLAHYEVLLRLRTANGSLLEPKEFLARAAQQRLMPNIDRWVVRTLLVWLGNNRKLWARVPSVFSINCRAAVHDRRQLRQLRGGLRRSRAACRRRRCASTSRNASLLRAASVWPSP